MSHDIPRPPRGAAGGAIRDRAAAIDAATRYLGQPDKLHAVDELRRHLGAALAEVEQLQSVEHAAGRLLDASTPRRREAAEIALRALVRPAGRWRGAVGRG